MGHGRHRHRIVQRRTEPVVEALGVARPVEREQIGHDGRHVGPGGADGGDARGVGADLVGDVQAGHQQARPRFEHHHRRLGIAPDVELGRGGDVAGRGAPAHERDAGDEVGQVGREPEGQREVGERPGRHEPAPGPGAHGLDEELDGVAGSGRTRQRREAGSVQPRLAVHLLRVACLGDQRTGRAGVDSHVEVEHLCHHERVARRALDPDVAADGRDPEQLGVATGQHHRHGVVLAGIAVEDDRRTLAHGRQPGTQTPALGWAVL